MSAIKDLPDNRMNVEADEVGPESRPAADDVSVAKRPVGSRVVVRQRKAEGRVDGFWSCFECWGARLPEEVFFLPEGQQEIIPENTAVLVLAEAIDNPHGVDPYWTEFETPLGATLTGPLYWAWGKPTERETLARRRSKGLISSKKVERITSLSLAAVLAPVFSNANATGLAMLVADPTVLGVNPGFLTGAISAGIFSHMIASPIARPIKAALVKRRARQPLNLIDDVSAHTRTIVMPKLAHRALGLEPEAMALEAPVVKQEALSISSEVDQSLASYRASYHALMSGAGALDRNSMALLKHSHAEVENAVQRVCHGGAGGSEAGSLGCLGACRGRDRPRSHASLPRGGEWHSNRPARPAGTD
jgi:hypothetical protein